MNIERNSSFSVTVYTEDSKYWALVQKDFRIDYLFRVEFQISVIKVNDGRIEGMKKF